ncbi:MAG: shikimate dehydrogenase [Gloeocapsa sp. DLM2.Bin57]|nr:MAG: shikimate dehydrogenase [Gloeocapsa sp. DLM2.Bin57]
MQLITGKTKLLGVIGDPIEHSLSPVMHNAGIKALGVDYVYIPLAIKTEDLEGAIAAFRGMNLEGFNVTIPHKQRVMEFLDEVSPLAKKVGATNTVWANQEGWSGTNTDVAGFLAPLKLLERNWGEIKPLVLGYGGAARAVVEALSGLGCRQIRVVGRNLEKLAQFQKGWLQVEIYQWSELSELIADSELLVNTTPIGMYPYGQESPLEGDLVKLVQPGAIVYDLIYTPRPTKLLRESQQQGAVIIDGLEMLINQGAIALEIWLQRSVPVEVMRQALLNHLHILE